MSDCQLTPNQAWNQSLNSVFVVTGKESHMSLAGRFCTVQCVGLDICMANLQLTALDLFQSGMTSITEMKSTVDFQAHLSKPRSFFLENT